ncbi:MAG: TRAP transporter small permease [Acetomicrobium flavidum]|uniref:TRAP transporter small permease n=1 Tax=Acetomicrobium flavidum TaxID=49896 RepID=UPI0016BA0606|nr:TRAP transporter small permease [Acetomicrobium flavidum]
MNIFLKLILNLDLLLASCMFILLVSVTFIGVIMRYVINQPFIWLEEVQLLSFVWIVFLSSGAAFRTGSHVAIEFIVDRLPRPFRMLAEVLIGIIVIGVLCYFARAGFLLAYQMSLINRQTNILNIPYALIYAVFPLGCVLMLVNYGYFFVYNIIVLCRNARNIKLENKASKSLAKNSN